MKKLLAVLFLIPALASAQGVILPEGSNTLKSLHLRGYPGLGIYSPSAGVILFGNETYGIQCTWGGSCVFTSSGTTAAPMVSTLATNAPDVAASIWGVSNRLDFEGTTANDFETEIAVVDPTADRLFTLPNATGTAFISTLATNAPDAADAVWGGTNQLIFEGATGGADAFETVITPTDPTADQTITLPNASGAMMISTLTTNAPDAANAVTGASNSLIFEGATGGGDAFETNITVVDPTADNTFTLPNYTGTAMISTLATNAPDVADSIWGVQGALYFEGSTADTFEAVIIPGNPTADRALTLPNASGTFAVNPSITADAVVEFGSTVKADATADDRFDVTGSSETLSIGILAGSGPSAQGSDYEVVANGRAYIAPAEDQTVTRGHFLVQSATAGKVNDSASITTIGLNIGKALYSEGVTAVINHAGCAGGCVNTALNTPNVGPAGQITLGVDVAALGWAAGQPVTYWNSGGANITGLDDGFVYWLVSVSTTNVTIARTKGGAVIVPSGQGNDATQYLQRLPMSIVSIQ